MKSPTVFGWMASVLLLLGACWGTTLAADPLPGTKPLDWEGDLAAKMIDGLHTYLDRAIADSVQKRQEKWKPDYSSPAAYLRSVEPNRQRLKALLGVGDARVTPNLQFVGGPDSASLVAVSDDFTVRAVHWAVLPGLDAEGLLLEPKGGKAIANIVAIPDADQTPEQIVGLAKGLPNASHYARRLAASGCRVLVPTLIDRKDTYSGSVRFNRWTNQPHREFIYRMAFEMGRTLLGYEVQKVLAAVDWFQRSGKDKTPVGVFGYGEGGLIAMYSAAVDTRIEAAVISGSFGPREHLADEPIYRNVWGLLTEFGDGDALKLIFPRSAIVEWSPFTIDGPPKPRANRAGAAPGSFAMASPAVAQAEMTRAMQPAVAAWNGPQKRSHFIVADTGKGKASPFTGPGLDNSIQALLVELSGPEVALADVTDPPTDRRGKFDPEPRHKRQFDQLVTLIQKLWRESDFVRDAYFQKADATSLAAWDQSCEPYRKHLHEEIIGRLPVPTLPLNPRTRQVYDEPKFTGYEVVLDLHPDVFAYGIVLLPKGLKPGEKRPVVVCQHGLSGTPRKTIDPEERPVYDQFARKLVEKGYIVFSPQNPTYNDNHFRQVQRKANAVKLSLFSFIVAQHGAVLDWLSTLPNVDVNRIGFYGLSYGGKTAMRVPALEKRYKAVVCSGDFNEWIGKIVSLDLRASYMFTKEYEIGEYNLGHTFNYAEMAALIAPRAFMVERGHDDGVGIDPWVASEYAKVRYLYANRLKIPERTTIEFSVGGHRNYCKGSFDFLDKHLGPIRR
ncbi:MAG: dienelactone hydrolase family protein [Bacteroidales bacterium]|nr:dienelactone hydrolase family protein [Bacteroidales bacterium]